MKTIQEQIEVMQHYANGGEIEYTDKGYDKWVCYPCPRWNWADFDYRIKEQKKAVIIEKWLLKTKGKESYWEYATNNIDLYVVCHLGIEKVKLLETYEVEL